MELKLNHKGITARLYRWFYVEDKMPENLCPYFWKCVSMYILLLPYTIFCLPSIILDAIFKKQEWFNVNNNGDRRSMSVIFYIGCLLLLLMIGSLSIFTKPFEYVEANWGLYFVGLLGWFVLFVVGFVYAGKKIQQAYKNKIKDKTTEEIESDVKLKTSSMIVSFYKAKKEKYCPKIEWLNKYKNE